MLNMTAECGGTVSLCPEASPADLVVVDLACCGCGKKLKQQNIWHLMTRAFTVWFSMRALNMTRANIMFTRRRPYGIVSTQLWRSVVGNGEILRSTSNKHPRFCARKLLMNRMSQSVNVWMSTRKIPVDRLWTLAKHPRECAPEHKVLFRQFAHDIAWGSGVAITGSIGTDQCFLSRGTSRDSRQEMNLDQLRQSLPQLKVMHLDTHLDLKEQIEKVIPCRVLIGLHGAHMMHAMWLSPGTAVHEIHTIHKTKNYYYRNIALLAGARYIAHPICERGCAGKIVNGSTWIDPVYFKRILEPSKKGGAFPAQKAE